MPHRARPMTGLLLFTGVNLLLLNTITPVYDFVCFHPYWERRISGEGVVSEALLVPISRARKRSEAGKQNSSSTGAHVRRRKNTSWKVTGEI
uniref:FAE domain-containing protein n=1 Tax=Oryza meridionalis TaxID=40149 RepID=A0A0E0F2A3_9ORYZ